MFVEYLTYNYDIVMEYGMKILTVISLALLMVLPTTSVQAGLDTTSVLLGAGVGIVIGRALDRHNHHYYHYPRSRVIIIERGYRNYGTYKGARRVCHTVSSYGTWDGHPAKIGATQCYDRWGYPYIVPHTHYLIRFTN